MSSTPINRKTVRAAIAAGLSSGVTSAAAVYGYQETDLGGVSPAVRVYGSGVERPQLAQRGIRSSMYFTVEVWVLLTDRTGSWTESNAEDKLDDVEHEIVTWITGNQLGSLWTALKYADRSFVEVVNLSGDVYVVESIPVVAEVYG